MRHHEVDKLGGLAHMASEKLLDGELAARQTRAWAEDSGLDDRLPCAFDELTALQEVIRRTLDDIHEAEQRLRAGEDVADEIAALWRAAHALQERLGESPLVLRFRGRS